MYTLVYSINNEPNPETVYINLTNACTNSCVFCLREQKDDVCGAQMWHDGNYTLEDVIEQFKGFLRPHPDPLLKERGIIIPQNVVFCGYGEPFLKKDMMKAFAQYLRENYPEIKIRVNTNGHANFVYKKNVVPELVGLVDEFSVSLNGSNSDEYNELSQPKFEQAYVEVKNFIQCSSEAGIKTVASIVDGYKGRRLDVEKCKQIANGLGAELRVREWIQNGYS